MNKVEPSFVVVTHDMRYNEERKCGGKHISTVVLETLSTVRVGDRSMEDHSSNSYSESDPGPESSSSERLSMVTA